MTDNRGKAREILTPECFPNPATIFPPQQQDRRITFFTNSDSAECNPILAIIHEIRRAAPHVIIHIAGDPGIAERVTTVFFRGNTASSYSVINKRDGIGASIAGIFVHALGHQSSLTAAASLSNLGSSKTSDHNSGLFNTAKAMHANPTSRLQPWSIAEYALIYSQCKEILTHVKPDFSVVEPSYSPAITLLAHRKTPNWLLFCAENAKDFAASVQPGKVALWKSPL